MTELAGWVAAVMVLVGAGSPGQDTLTVVTERLSFHLDPAGGAMELRVKDASGDAVHTARFPRLLLDGVAQTGFTPAGPGRARTGDLDVALEVLGPRAIAVTWTPRDGALHDFRLELESDDRTRYYGTGERFNALHQRGYTLPLPSLEIKRKPASIFDYRFDDFEIKGYESHPHIPGKVAV